MRNKVDFTTGSNIKNILVFAIPVLFGEILQQLYSTVDSMIAGKYSGEAALAAVSVCNPTAKLIVALFSGLSIGSGVVMSKAVGFGDKKQLLRKGDIMFSSGLFLGVLVSLAGLALAIPLLEISQPRADYYAEALLYLRITFAGAFGSLTYNILAGTLRALGDSKSTFIILAATGVLNVVLDYVFVRFLGWGVAGVAVATTIAEILSAVLAFIKVRKYIPGFGLNLRDLKNGLDVVKEALSIGISVAIQSMALFVSNMFIYRYINMFETTAVAGISAAQKLDSFATMPASSLSAALSTAVGQNLGAAKYKRIKPMVREAMFICVGMTVAISLIMYLISPFLVGLFSDKQEVIDTGVMMVSTLMPFYSAIAVRQILAAGIRPYGRTFWPSMSVIFGMVAMRQLFLAIFMNTAAPNIQLIFYCYPIGWGMSLLPMIFYYIFATKKLKGFRAKLTPEQEAGA